MWRNISTHYSWKYSSNLINQWLLFINSAQLDQTNQEHTPFQAAIETKKKNIAFIGIDTVYLGNILTLSKIYKRKGEG